MVADGNTGIEHNLPQSELYDDVYPVLLWHESWLYPQPLVVTYGGIRGEGYYYQQERRFGNISCSPPMCRPHVLQPASVRRQKAPTEDYADAVSAATAKKLAEAGVPR